VNCAQNYYFIITHTIELLIFYYTLIKITKLLLCNIFTTKENAWIPAEIALLIFYYTYIQGTWQTIALCPRHNTNNSNANSHILKMWLFWPLSRPHLLPVKYVVALHAPPGYKPTDIFDIFINQTTVHRRAHKRPVEPCRHLSREVS
jgi:hypothetical protein